MLIRFIIDISRLNFDADASYGFRPERKLSNNHANELRGIIKLLTRSLTVWLYSQSDQYRVDAACIRAARPGCLQACSVRLVIGCSTRLTALCQNRCRRQAIWETRSLHDYVLPDIWQCRWISLLPHRAQYFVTRPQFSHKNLLYRSLVGCQDG